MNREETATYLATRLAQLQSECRALETAARASPVGSETSSILHKMAAEKFERYSELRALEQLL